MKKILLILIAIVISTACEKGSSTTIDDYIPPNTPEDPETIKVLYIGASYFDDIPTMVFNFSTNTGKKISYDYSIVTGRRLDFHVNYDITLNLINKKDWDYVILQGVGINVAYPEPPEYYPYEYAKLLPNLKKMYNLIKSNYAETKIIFCMPWAYEGGMKGFGDEADDYFEMQQKIYDNTLGFIESVGVSIAPIGWAFRDIMIEDPPLHYLYDADYSHLSFKGKYLMASVLYSVLYQEDPRNIEYYIQIDKDEADHFHEVANEIVFTDFSLWNIPAID